MDPDTSEESKSVSPVCSQLGSESWMRRDAAIELGMLRDRCACEPEDFEALDTLANIIEAYAAEVRRLREARMIEAGQRALAESERDRLRAKLVRVEALVRLWKCDRVFVVDELEAALRE